MRATEQLIADLKQQVGNNLAARVAESLLARVAALEQAATPKAAEPTRLKHYMGKPGVALCGADKPNQWLVDQINKTTCRVCLEIIDGWHQCDPDAAPSDADKIVPATVEEWMNAKGIRPKPLDCSGNGTKWYLGRGPYSIGNDVIFDAIPGGHAETPDCRAFEYESDAIHNLSVALLKCGEVVPAAPSDFTSGHAEYDPQEAAPDAAGKMPLPCPRCNYHYLGPVALDFFAPKTRNETI